MAQSQNTPRPAKRPPARSGGEVFCASFVHYRTGRRIYAAAYGHKAFRFPRRKR